MKKIKIFDWLLIITCLLSIVFFAFIFFRKSTSIIVTINVGEDSFFYNHWLSGSPYWNDTSGTKNWYANLFYKGQKEKDGLGKTQAEIIDIYTYDKTQNKKAVYLKTRLNVVFSRATGTYTFKGVPVLVGSKIKVNFSDVFTEGIITDIEGMTEQKSREKIVLEAKIMEDNPTYLETSGTKQFLADAIKVGDEVKDNNGNLLIKILSKTVKPSLKTVATSNGQLILSNDPIIKDVELKIEVNALKIDGKYFIFEDVPLLVGQYIPINTSTVSFFPIVTKFLDNENSSDK